MFDLAFQTAVVTWIKQTTGLAFAYAANQNGQNPYPTGYATYNIIGLLPHTHADHAVAAGASPGDVDYTYVAHTAVTVSVNVYHEAGAKMIVDLFNSKRTLAGRKPFYDISASLLSFSGVRDLSAVRDAQYQARYQADFVFNYRTVLVETNKTVDKLSITGTIELENVEIIGWDNP
jgi:hypothetical protein